MARVHVASWGFAYRHLFPKTVLSALSIPDYEAKWRESIVVGASRILVAESDGVIVGLLEFGPSRDAGTSAGSYEIWALYVDPDFRSCGIGRALCSACIFVAGELGAKTLSLWTLVDNSPARQFYLTLGFVEQAGVRRAYERGGVALEQMRYAQAIGS